MSIKIKHDDKEFVFRRVYAGIGWPAEKPGFLTVLGEENRIVQQKTWPLTSTTAVYFHILDEFETWDFGELIQKAIEFKARYGVETFYARSHKPAKDFVDTFNREAHKQRKVTFYFTQPSHMDAPNEAGQQLQYHISILRDLHKDGTLNKLELEGKKLYNYLFDVPQEDLHKATDLKHPAAASLAYVATALKSMLSPDELELEAQELEAAMDASWLGDP